LARFFCASAGVSHWAAVHYVMGYLHNNPSFKPYICVGPTMDWTVFLILIGETVSHVGLLGQYNKAIVLWLSRKQKTIVLSTAEAEYNSEIAVEIFIFAT
jgi:hypothetical protein